MTDLQRALTRPSLGAQVVHDHFSTSAHCLGALGWTVEGGNLFSMSLLEIDALCGECDVFCASAPSARCGQMLKRN